MSMKMHFGNPASLTYQLHPSKQIFLSLLRDTEKLDEPCLLSCFSADAFHVPEVLWNKTLPNFPLEVHLFQACFLFVNCEFYLLEIGQMRRF